MEDGIVKKHEMKRNLVEIVVTPEHEKRTESAEFRVTKKLLRKDEHYKCFICDSREDLEVHHFAIEWSLSNVADFKKVKEFCELFDVYGYGKKMKDIPMTSPDDPRNMLVLCRSHHTGGMTDGVANGIHNLSFPIWISQKLCKESPVPKDTQELNEDLK